MNSISLRDLWTATRQTRSGRLIEATALIQRALQGQPASGEPRSGEREPLTIDVEATEITKGTGYNHEGVAAGPHFTPRTLSANTRRAIPEGRGGFLDLAGRVGRQLQGGIARSFPSETAAPGVAGSQFLSAIFTNRAGTRPYKLYIPSTYCGQPVPLIVMLHGCTQSPDDFAAGTRMNAAAEETGSLILYPGQTVAANSSKCWNWFSTGDQMRDRGEPCVIAGITREVIRQYAVDAGRVYVAGLSAGGAAAAIMGRAYPDLYAAVGVHSGLACGAAHDLPSAFIAMRQGGHGSADAQERAERWGPVRTIVLHGDRDTTVHRLNADLVIAQAMSGTTLHRKVREGRVPGGHAYSVTTHTDATGKAAAEQWVIHGAGHAWSGGSSAGSYTDPRGPDATREMLRFFLQQENTSGPRH